MRIVKVINRYAGENRPALLNVEAIGFIQYYDEDRYEVAVVGDHPLHVNSSDAQRIFAAMGAVL